MHSIDIGYAFVEKNRRLCKNKKEPLIIKGSDQSCLGDLNPRPPPYQGDALPTEPRQHINMPIYCILKIVRCQDKKRKFLLFSQMLMAAGLLVWVDSIFQNTICLCFKNLICILYLGQTTLVCQKRCGVKSSLFDESQNVV